MPDELELGIGLGLELGFGLGDGIGLELELGWGLGDGNGNGNGLEPQLEPDDDVVEFEDCFFNSRQDLHRFGRSNPLFS